MTDAIRVGIEAYRSFEAMSAATKLHAVVVATPPTVHRHVVTQALQQRLHVLCTGPLATTGAEARALGVMSGRDRLLAGDYPVAALVADAVRQVAAGAIGTLVSCEATWLTETLPASEWVREDPLAGGVMVALGTDLLAALRLYSSMKVGTVAARRSSAPDRRPAIADDVTVSTLTVRPNQSAVS